MATLTQPMSTLSNSTSNSAGSDLPRKVILLFLLEIALAFGFYLLVRNSTAVPLLGANLLAIMLMGMASGLATRVVLHQRSWFVRSICGMAALIVALYVLGMLTHWLIGIGPLVFWRKSIDWIGLGKLGIGLLGFLLSMQAWWKPAVSAAVVVPTSIPVSVPEITTAPVPTKAPAPKRTSQAKVRAKPKRSRQAHFPLLSPKGKPAAARKSARSGASSKTISKPAAKPRRSLFQHKPQVHLSKIERHLCPYCLEPVTRNDARGVVECDICHTLHHGDCWAIAGACQVPHYTA